MISFSTLFWIMCAVLGAHVLVAVIAIGRAYRDERSLNPSARRLGSRAW